MSLKFILLAGGVLLAASSFSQVLADSVADFSSTQGQGGWFYGYYDKTADGGAGAVYDHTTDFKLMTLYKFPHSMNLFAPRPAWTVNDTATGVWTMLWNDGGHPNGLTGTSGRTAVEHFPIRRWVSTYAGTITISGSISKIDTSSASNGTAFRLRKNSVNIANDGPVTSATPVNYSVTVVAAVGDVFDLTLDSWMANCAGDSSKLTMHVVQAVPEPVTLTSMTLGLALLVRRRKRQK